MVIDSSTAPIVYRNPEWDPEFGNYPGKEHGNYYAGLSLGSKLLKAGYIGDCIKIMEKNMETTTELRV